MKKFLYMLGKDAEMFFIVKLYKPAPFFLAA